MIKIKGKKKKNNMKNNTIRSKKNTTHSHDKNTTNLSKTQLHVTYQKHN